MADNIEEKRRVGNPRTFGTPEKFVGQPNPLTFKYLHFFFSLERGLDLIEQKNQMIEILKRDLAESDSRFLEEQRAQSEDVRILQERIENQMKFIRKQYKNHIQYIKVSSIRHIMTLCKHLFFVFSLY